MTYEQACMDTPREKYYTKMLETLVDYNDRKNVPLSNEKIWQEMGKLISEEEADERIINLDDHNLTVDTFYQSPVMTNTQG